MIQPNILYKDEILRRGIGINDIISASELLQASIGVDFFEKEERIHRSAFKNSLEHLMNRHPLAFMLTSPVVNTHVRMIALADAIKRFANQPSMPEYLARLRVHEQMEATIFELLLARNFQIAGLEVSLQKPDKNGDPIDIFISDGKNDIWAECKTFYFKPGDKSLQDTIFRKLMPVLKKFNNNTVIEIVVIDDSANKQEQMILNLKRDLLSCQSSEVAFPVVFENDCYELKAYTHDLSDSFMKELNQRFDYMISHAVTLADDISQIWPKIGAKGWNKGHRENVIALSIPNPKKKKQEKENKTIFNELKKKVKQQKNLIKEDKNVLILIDSMPTDSYQEIVSKCKSEFGHHSNLSIEMASENIGKNDVEFFYKQILTGRHLR